MIYRPEKTPLRLAKNARAFKIKRKGVFEKASLRFFTLLFHGLIVLGKSSFTRFLVQGWEVVSGLLHYLYHLVE